jgi:DNA-binding GntR family transcriptional regulator
LIVGCDGKKPAARKALSVDTRCANRRGGVSLKQKTHHFAATLKYAARMLSDRPSVVEHVEEFLRELIVSGNLKPGERIVETQIARQLGIGQPAVREALKTLEAEGLVVRQPNRGCSVITLSPAEINQIFSLRVELEVLAVKMAMEAGASKDTQEMSKTLQNTKAAARQGETAKFYRSDLEFHQSLWRLAGNSYLERALTQLMVPLFAFTMIKVATDPEFDMNDGARQHERIVAAIQSGNKRLAMQVTREVLNGFWKDGRRHLATQDELKQQEGGVSTPPKRVAYTRRESLDRAR